jgi:HK97 family phage portal protein
MGVFSGPRLGDVTRAGGAQAAAREMWGITGIRDLIPVRPSPGPTRPVVTPDSALRHSAVWACLRLRANMLSSMPAGVWRAGPGGERIACPIPQVLIAPGGPKVRRPEWIFSTQWDLDRMGNVVGIIRAWDGNGLPAVIELAATSSVQILAKGMTITGYKIDGVPYPPEQIWHEKQYTVPGLPIGLSPVAYAALTLGQYASIQDFALNWFGTGGVPRARLRNTQKKLVGKEAVIVKEAWRAAITTGEPFVHGNDWEYDMIQAQEASSDWLNAQQASVLDIARWFDAPGDLIEASVQTSRMITYANITQRHLQFLVTSLGPAVTRREDALSTLTAQPRWVELDTNSVLRMDPQTKAAWQKTLVDARLRAPSELRADDGLPPYTPAQLGEFATFWPPKAPAPVAPAPAGPQLPPGGTP